MPGRGELDLWTIQGLFLDSSWMTGRRFLPRNLSLLSANPHADPGHVAAVESLIGRNRNLYDLCQPDHKKIDQVQIESSVILQA